MHVQCMQVSDVSVFFVCMIRPFGLATCQWSCALDIMMFVDASLVQAVGYMLLNDFVNALSIVMCVCPQVGHVLQ